jgi:hypothetical protein
MITHHQKISPRDLFHAGWRDGLISLRGRLDTPLTRREAGSNPSHPFTKAPGGLRYLFLPLAYAKVQRGCLYRP